MINDKCLVYSHIMLVQIFEIEFHFLYLIVLEAVRSGHP